MRVLFVVSGTERVAATRYRVCQYLPHLAQEGISYCVFSITSDMVTRLAIRSPEFGEAARLAYYTLAFIEKFFRFWAVFFLARRFDIIFLQRATFPFGLAKLLPMTGKKVIFDIDDAIFMPDSPKQNPLALFKAFIRERELKDILTISDSVIVENKYIKSYVSKFCKKVYKIPGPIDTERYYARPKTGGAAREIVLGWIGSPATTAYLHLLDNVFLNVLARFDNIRVVLVGTGNYLFTDRRVKKVSWSYGREVEYLNGFDIGLMPMPDDEWSRGKLGCKMLQYMAMGVPSVVSYTTTNAELIRSGENGFLVKTEEDWIKRLSELISDEGLRERIGSAGRRTIEETCSVKRNLPKLIAVFKDTIKDETD